MIIKKAFITTSCFLLTAALLSKVYSYTNARFNTPAPDFSAFKNLISNVESIKTPRVIASQVDRHVDINNDIINVINSELKGQIKKTRYAVRNARPIIIEDKVKVVALVSKKIAEDLSAYEINSKGLIDLFAMSVDFSSFNHFEKTINIAGIDVKDEVATTQSSTEAQVIHTDEVKMIQPSPEMAQNADDQNVASAGSDDDMVMFDYSENKQADETIEKSIDKKLYERPISDTVRAAINREIGSLPLKKLTPKKSLNTQKAEDNKLLAQEEIDLDSEKNIIYDYSKENSKPLAQEEIENSFTESQAQPMNTQFRIVAREINLNNQKSQIVSALEFVPDVDRAERISNAGTNEIVLEYSQSGQMSTQTGVVQAHGSIPTRIEVNYGSAAGMTVPLINEKGMNEFLQKKSLNIEGNLLLLAVDPSILETEIDSSYETRFFFDKNFKQVESRNGANYEMFAGVGSGNVMIRFLLSNKETAQKIIYIGEGEMYFEDPDFVSSARETFTLTTRNLLGKKKKELVIDGTNIHFFNTNVSAKKKALNAYEIKIPHQVQGMRKYLEFSHLKDKVFVGTSQQKEIEVPSYDFIAKVLEMNQVNSLKDRCVVQLNLIKDLREVRAGGKNKSGEMYVEANYLDRDGNFSHDAELADKVFVLGDQEGIFSIRLDYTDGSSEYLKTYCSEGNYLIEQL